jgi:hypothetical protein
VIQQFRSINATSVGPKKTILCQIYNLRLVYFSYIECLYILGLGSRVRI